MGETQDKARHTDGAGGVPPAFPAAPDAGSGNAVAALAEGTERIADGVAVEWAPAPEPRGWAARPEPPQRRPTRRGRRLRPFALRPAPMTPEQFTEAEERLHEGLAEALRERREYFHLTQRELARRVGTTQSAISRQEDPRWRKRSLFALCRMASLLECRVEIKLRATGPPLPQEGSLQAILLRALADADTAAESKTPGARERAMEAFWSILRA